FTDPAPTSLSTLSLHDALPIYYVRLPDEYGYFQLDFLLLSHHFFLIMEVKNIHLNMIFDNMGQAFRNRDGEVELFENPVEQVNLQHIRLLNWLRKYNFPPVPIEKIVVYSRDDTYLRNIANDKVISAIVMHRDKVIPKIKSFMKKYQSPLISETELMELSYQLLKEQKDEADDGMNKFNISYNDLVKGVFCTKCGTFPIMRSEEHTSELQSRFDLVCRLLLEKKNKEITNTKRT